MKNQVIIDRIIAIIIAVGLWFYVISVVNPPTELTLRSVPVKLLNETYLQESGLAIAGDGNYTVDVVLSGKRTDLMVKASDLTVTADLNGLTPGQNYITVKVGSPAGTTVEEIRTERIQVYIDEYVSIAKPVVYEILNVPEGMETAALSLDKANMVVSGARSLVNMVRQVKATMDAAQIEVDEIKGHQLALTPVDAEGNQVNAVKLDAPYVTLTATLYNVKSVPLYTRVEGNPGLGIELVSSNIPSSVVIKGALIDLAQIDHIDAEPISIEGITGNTEKDVTPILPDGVELSDANEALTASFTLSENGSIDLELSSEDIVLEGLAENYEAEVLNTPFELTLTIKGAVRDLIDISTGDIDLYADLSGVDEAGDYAIPIEAVPLQSKVLSFTFSPAMVHVSITDLTAVEEPEAEETTEEPAEPDN
ncbi:MAG: hypothetical protein K5981_08225 [Clostridia bacterium]|nr:hypothetical protein [Clostridia bacterium]